jgi:TDG/mug DNA glycosylase family protein
LLDDLVEPGMRVVIAGTIAQWHREQRDHYYAGAGNQFWTLLHASGLVPRRLRPEEDHLAPSFGVGLTDLVGIRRVEPGEPPVFDLRAFLAVIRRADPLAVAFVSKTAAASYARAAGERAPRGYGALSWLVAGRPAFVLPGPSGANNGMHLPLRIALWRDLADFLETLDA